MSKSYTGFGLIAVCAALVGVGVLVRLNSKADSPDAHSPGAAGPLRPPSSSGQATSSTPASSQAVDQLNRRLIQDDRLTPPGPGATPEELAAYQNALDAVARGQDPLKPAAGSPPSAVLEKRLVDRKRVAEERRKKAEEQHKLFLEKQKKVLAEAEKYQKPGEPLPPPLFEPPKLGPTVIEDKR